MDYFIPLLFSLSSTLLYPSFILGELTSLDHFMHELESQEHDSSRNILGCTYTGSQKKTPDTHGYHFGTKRVKNKIFKDLRFEIIKGATKKFAHHVYTESRVAVIGTDKDDTFFRKKSNDTQTPVNLELMISIADSIERECGINSSNKQDLEIFLNCQQYYNKTNTEASLVLQQCIRSVCSPPVEIIIPNISPNISIDKMPMEWSRFVTLNR
ncbi:uncharacterized protein LOC142338461 [Convolutriloba macropyga]|uniref:uncharacterized protein LOC142338461 n=1 Tax=Convolutriloba macropyga TaxID=536237 RepID=UPI003F52742D